MVAAYDPGRHILVAYGGDSGLPGQSVSFLFDTWAWDGTNWSLVASSGPQLVGPEISYDPATKTVIMLGTGPTFEAACETWSWTGSIWQQLHPASAPGARTQASLAPDADYNGMVLFGGRQPLPLSDTWTWNGLNWTQRKGLGPGARNDAAFALDESRHRVVLAGGAFGDGSPFRDTWLWDGAQWTQVAVTQFPAAGSPVVAVDTGQQVLLIDASYNVLVRNSSDWSAT